MQGSGDQALKTPEELEKEKQEKEAASLRPEITFPAEHEKYRYMIVVQKNVSIHQNLFDDSLVEYFTNS